MASDFSVVALPPMATRDAVLHATARLAGDWDAPAFARTTLSVPGGKPILRELAARFASLDPLVRVRLLLSAAHIAPKSAREACASELAALAAAPLTAAARSRLSKQMNCQALK